LNLKKYIINSTILNIFVKVFNYLYYLCITLFIGYGVQTDSIIYIEGVIGFTLLLPLQLISFTLIPKLVKDKEYFAINFSTMLLLAFVWSLFWVGVYSIFLIDIITIFYPGLNNNYLLSIDLNYIYILIFMIFVLLNNIMSISLDAIQKHTSVYKVLLVKSLVSLVILYLYKDSQNVLFLVLVYSIIVEFIFYLFIYKKYLVLKFNISFFLEQLKDVKYILLFAFVGIIFGVMDRYFISYLDSGSMTILKYSTLIIGMISGLIPIARILYPYLSQSTNEKQLYYFYKAMKVILSIYIPIFIFVYIFPNVIPDLLFGYGKVNNEQIVQMGKLLLFLVPTAIFGLLIGILDKILFLQKLYRALFYRLIATVLINGIGNYLSVFVFGWGLDGIVFFTMMVHIYILYSSYVIIKKEYLISNQVSSYV
jgi:O-antigen/teichoic acid export membrane protein